MICKEHYRYSNTTSVYKSMRANQGAFFFKLGQGVFERMILLTDLWRALGTISQVCHATTGDSEGKGEGLVSA